MPPTTKFYFASKSKLSYNSRIPALKMRKRPPTHLLKLQICEQNAIHRYLSMKLFLHIYFQTANQITMKLFSASFTHIDLSSH